MTQQTEDTPEAAATRAQEPQKEKKTLIPFKRLKFQTGLIVLFAAMAAMVSLVLLDVFCSMRTEAEGTLVSNAFEAFKLIAVSVLGYIFGTNNASTGDS